MMRQKEEKRGREVMKEGRRKGKDVMQRDDDVTKGREDRKERNVMEGEKRKEWMICRGRMM
jgi:hypothetical protein